MPAVVATPARLPLLRRSCRVIDQHFMKRSVRPPDGAGTGTKKMHSSRIFSAASWPRRAWANTERALVCAGLRYLAQGIAKGEVGRPRRAQSVSRPSPPWTVGGAWVHGQSGQEAERGRVRRREKERESERVRETERVGRTGARESNVAPASSRQPTTSQK